MASSPTISRLIDRLADDEAAVLAALRSARAAARERAWKQAGAPLVREKVVLDLDATLITAHSEKETAAKTWKKGFGFHPIGAWIDHGRSGTGEPAGWLLRRGSAGANTTADHQAMLAQVLDQIPAEQRECDAAGWRPVLVRTDAAGATHGFAKTLHREGLAFSLGAPSGPCRKWPRCWTRCPPRHGHRPTTPTAVLAAARGSPKSPTPATSQPGPRAPG